MPYSGGEGCIPGCFLIFIIVGCVIAAFNMHGDGKQVPPAIYIVGFAATILLALYLLKLRRD